MPAPLHYKLLHSSSAQAPAGKSAQPRVMVWLHSLLSSGRMYEELAQQAIDQAAAATGDPWLVVLVDQRCHGGSWGLEGLQPPHSVEIMAEDTIRLLKWGWQEGRWDAPELLLGHSIGGLVALEVTRRLGQASQGQGPEELRALGVPKQVWVIDSRTFKVSPDTSMRKARLALLAEIHEVSLPAESPEPLFEAAGKFFRAGGIQEDPAWLQTLLHHTLKPNPSGPGLVRQYDIDALSQMLASYYASDFRSFLEAPPPGCTLHLVRGVQSDDWLEDGEAEAAFWREREAAGKGLRLYEIPGADHWIPITHPQQLLDIMGQEVAGLKH